MVHWTISFTFGEPLLTLVVVGKPHHGTARRRLQLRIDVIALLERGGDQVSVYYRDTGAGQGVVPVMLVGLHAAIGNELAGGKSGQAIFPAITAPEERRPGRRQGGGLGRKGMKIRTVGPAFA